MNLDPSHVALFHESLNRATAHPDFFHRFYDRFMRSSEEISRIFQGRDMARIEKKLKTTLEMVTENADGQPGLTMYLEMLGRIHDRLQISQAMFDRWRVALIDTAAECDPEFDDATRTAWETVIGDIIAKLRRTGPAKDGE